MKLRRTIEFKARVAGFLIAFTSVGAAQNGPAPAAPAPAPPPLSPVIWAEDPDVVQRFAVDDEKVRQMVDSEILKLTSASDLGTAWARLGVTPKDVVGIKITTRGGQILSTHRAIVEAICDGLEAAGVSPSHIIIWDKNASDMRAAGYAPAAATDSRVAIESVFPGTGYDPNVTYKNEILGKLIWGDSEFSNSEDDLTQAMENAAQNRPYNGGSGVIPATQEEAANGSNSKSQNSLYSHYARLITTACTKIINVPVLTDNGNIGMEGCLGSLALASVDNNRRFQGDPTFGDPAICEILSHDVIRHKVILQVLDALISQYAGGPRFDPQFTKSIGAIYVSRDPVAIDSIVLKRLEQWRATDRNGHIDPIGAAASHIHDAAAVNLGTDDPRRIQLVRVP